MIEKELLCTLDGCIKKRKNNDKYCSMHRARYWRTGKFSKTTPHERMMLRVVKTKTGCLEYTGFITLSGYGRLRNNGKKCLAHRLAYENTFGKIPSGLLVCHKCDNPKCVNLKHLFLGTNKDNFHDSVKKGRRDCVAIAKRRWELCPTLRKN